MKRFYVVLIVFTMLLLYNTLALLHAEEPQEDIIPLEIENITISSTLHDIEVLSKHADGLQKFIIKNTIPQGVEAFLTKEKLESICQDILHQIAQGNIELLWVDQMYARMNTSPQNKEVIRFKYLVASRIEAILPEEAFQKTNVRSMLYGLSSPHTIEYPRLPIPVIPDNIETLFTAEESTYGNDMLPEDEARLSLPTAMGYSTEGRIKKAITPEEDRFKSIVEGNYEEHTEEHIVSKKELYLLSQPILQEEHTEGMYQNTLDNIKDKKKEERYKKYKAVEQLLEISTNNTSIED